MSRPVARLALAAALAAAAAAAAPGPAAAPAAAPAEEPVARVNGRPIARRDFDLAVQLQFRGRAADIGLAELRAVKEKVLERLIESELLHQQAATSGPAIPDADVDAEVRRLRDAFGAPDAFDAVLGESGVSETEFRAQVRRSLRIARFVEREVAPRTEVKEDEVRLYYEQNPREMTRPERARVRQILVRAPADAPPARAAARQKIEAILRDLRAGGDFAALARQHSDGQEAARGGDTGWVTRGAAPPPIENAAFGLPVGEISDIVETRLGYHILKVEERQGEGMIPFAEAKEAIRARLQARDRETRIEEYVAKLRNKARIERLLAPGPS
jgi:peptidyl-prolyl cis-trans isomerase C